MKFSLPNLNSPLPTNLAGECKKASKILNSFVDAGEGLDIIIPPSILEKAMGLAIFTVLKAGFLFSGRAGSGLVVARLSDGSWSAPSALFTGGIGAGGQIGAELTDFVLVLNTKEAVKTFSQFGNITLGGNVSIAAGPVGRNAEASGSASFKHISAVYSYSKTRGLFAGVSLEGSVICTRNDANEKLYGERFTAKQLLNGTVPPPREADSLYRALNAKFKTLGSTGAMYERTIAKEESRNYKKTNVSAPGTLRIPPVRQAIGGYGAPNLIGPPPTNDVLPPVNTEYNNYGPLSPPPVYANHTPLLNPVQPLSPVPQQFSKPHSPSHETNYASSSIGTRVPPPFYENQSPNEDMKKTILPPLFDGQRMNYSRDLKSAALAPNQDLTPQKAKALYAFSSQQTGDLSFEVGDVIVITEKTGCQDSWWTGNLKGQSGSFPSNYVQLL